MANTSVEREDKVLFLFRCYECGRQQRSEDKSFLQDVERRHDCSLYRKA